MFGYHTYLSVVTKFLSDHFRMIAEDADTLFCRDAKSKSVVDIGSNDGQVYKPDVFRKEV